MVSGPANSTPVYEKAGSSFTRKICRGGGLLKGAPSNFQWWIKYKRLPFGIPNFLLTLVNISLNPLWWTLSWASLTTSMVRGWFRGRSTGCLVANGAFMFDNHALQRQILLSYAKRLNCFWWAFESFSLTNLLGTYNPQHLSMSQLFWSQVSGDIFSATFEYSNSPHNIHSHSQQSR